MFSKGSSGGPHEPEISVPGGKPQPSSMPSIVSANLRINGDLISEGDVQIEGTVEGNITSRMLTVGESGTVKGEIVADQVTIAGAVIGKVKARTVTLAQTSDVTGDISHEALGIEAGARFEGSCKKIDMSKKDMSPGEEALRKVSAATASTAGQSSASAAGSSGGGAAISAAAAQK